MGVQHVEHDESRQCDEHRPVCENCKSRQIACDFSLTREATSTTAVPTRARVGEVLSTTSARQPSTNHDDKPDEKSSPSSFPDFGADVLGNVWDLPESKSRRMLELRLMNHWSEDITNLYPDSNGGSVTAWAKHIPKMALKQDNVLYMMYACSACHLRLGEPDDPEVAVACDVYLGLGLREQQKAVATLGVGNAEAVFFAAIILLTTSLARLSHRSLGVYTSPMEWLRLGRGAMAVLNTAQASFGEDPSSEMWRLINAPPVFENEIIFARENVRPFSKILEFDMEHVDQDRWDAYEKTLAYIGYVQRSMDENKPRQIIGRMFISFAMLAPSLFIELIEDQDPRALVILAHFFGLMARYHSVWWIGETPRREIQAIRKALPQRYQELMQWPVSVSERTTS